RARIASRSRLKTSKIGKEATRSCSRLSPRGNNDMLKEQMFMALDSLRANAFRSLLTMLGIIIGAATLVAVLSLGNALQGQVFERFIDLGTRRIAVQPGDPKAKGARDVPGYGLISIRDYETLEQLVARHPDVFRTLVP